MRGRIHIDMTPYQNYLNAQLEINEGLIRMGISMDRPEGYVRDPQRRMDEMRNFLECCNNPQQNIPAVHVAGTSGKGSVSAAIAGMLGEAGLKVGLHVTPYLQSATEKIWIDGSFVSAQQFRDLVSWIMPVAAPRVRPETPASIHGMASVAIALEGFRRAGVDVMVFEAGCGARFDLTSFVETSVAVITNVGLDHVVSLGPDIERIAWHKAGVARRGAPLVTGATGTALDVIRQEANSVSASLVEIPHTGNARIDNMSVASRAARLMGELLNAKMTPRVIEEGAQRVRLAGRTEVMPGEGPRVILDGAHNEQKLTVAIDQAFETDVTGSRVLVIGFLGTKASTDIVRPVAGRFDHVIATEPRVYGKTPCPAADTARLMESVGYTPKAEPDPHKAIERALDLAGSDGMVLVTGSFYLVGDLRSRWYSQESVVLGRTSWPADQSGQRLSK